MNTEQLLARDFNEAEQEPDTTPEVLFSEDDSLEFLEGFTKEELLELANQGDFDSYLEKLYDNNLVKEFDIDIQDIAETRFLHTINHCENPVLLLDTLYCRVCEKSKENTLTKKRKKLILFQEGFLTTLVNTAIDADSVPVLDWVVVSCCVNESNYQAFLERATLLLSLDSIEYLLALDVPFMVTPPILFVWVQRNTGNAHLDRCVSILAGRFLSGPFTEETELYPCLPLETLWAMDDYSFHTGETFREHCLEYLLLTPYMRYALEEGLISKETRNEMIKLLENNCFALLKNINFFRSSLPLIVIHGREGKPAQLDFNLVHDIYYDPVDLLDVLLTTHPRTMQRKSIRCLVTALALVDDPDPTMVERVKNIKGTHIEITRPDLPWFGKQEAQNEDLSSQCLFQNWEKVMPKQLKPAITYGTEICSAFGDRYVDLELWLPHVDVLGHPPTDTLSQIGQELLTYPCDHPLFLKSLEHDGFLWKEKKNLLKILHQKQYEQRGHFLVALSLMKEEKSYAL